MCYMCFFTLGKIVALCKVLNRKVIQATIKVISICLFVNSC